MYKHSWRRKKGEVQAYKFTQRWLIGLIPLAISTYLMETARRGKKKEQRNVQLRGEA